jgi:hypothetical protein
MIIKTKHSTTNYRAVMPFILAADMSGGHKHFESSGYMDLVIENLGFTDADGYPVYSITHYGEQNGDLMADPDMEIAINHAEGRIIPRTYRNDYMGVYQEVFTTQNGRRLYHPGLLRELDSFLWMWLRNIKAQGFKAA